jgi:tetratricopeptide (TPR) repeat protein
LILSGNQARKRHTENVPAYQAYLKGRYYWNKRTAEGISKSIDYYKEAVGLDPNYALAYAGIADSYVQGVWHVPFNPSEAIPKAKAAALKAVELDGSLAEAHTALASVYSMEWDWEGTGRELEQAIKLDPQYGRAYHVQGFHLMLMRRFDEAVASINQARELDPLNLVVNADAGEILFTAGREEEAFAQWKKTLELDQNFAMVHGHLYRAYVVKGNEPAALEEYFKVMELNGEPQKKIAAFRSAATRSGLRGVWQKELEESQFAQARGTYVPPINFAWYYALLGQNSKALENLERIYESHSPSIVLITSPMFGPLRTEPAFQNLVRRVGVRV